LSAAPTHPLLLRDQNSVGLERALASRRCRCVSLVGPVLADLARLQRVWATYSAQGATSLPHTEIVLLSLMVRAFNRRQLPLRSSKKSERRKGSRMIQSN